MASLTAIFGNSHSDDADSEKLLELYWNRAELKKEFANLREETFRLEKRLEEKRGDIARLQQKYDHLEGLLLDPEWAHSVTVHFQLRALNNLLKRKVMRFAEHLKLQQEKAEHRRLLQAWQDGNDREIEGLTARIEEQRSEEQRLEQQLSEVRNRFAEMGVIARFFKKRGITRELDEIVSAIEARKAEEEAMLGEIDEIGQRIPPDTQGLTIGQKRSINFMILSFVQHIFLHFEEENFASLAKEAGDKSVGSVRYGNKNECDSLLERLAARLASFEGVGNSAGELRQRAQFLSESAEFREEDDVLPIPNTVATVLRISDDRVVDRKDGNLLGQNYWDIGEAVSR